MIIFIKTFKIDDTYSFNSFLIFITIKKNILNAKPNLIETRNKPRNLSKKKQTNVFMIAIISCFS